MKTDVKSDSRRVCAWCGKILFEANGPISHGICVDCSKEVLRKVRELKNETH